MPGAVGSLLVYSVGTVYPTVISSPCKEVSRLSGCFTVQVRSAEGRGPYCGRVIRLRYAGMDSAESFERGLFLVDDSRLW